jgi:tRNA(Ile)-lysidine synthetase-like protein
METARAESDFVGSFVNDWLRSPHEDFENLEVAIQRRCLAARLLALGEQPEFDLIEWLRTAPGRAVTAPRGRMLVRLAGTGTIEIVQRCGGAFRSTQASFKVSSKGSGAFGDLHFSWRLLGGAELPARKAESCEVFDAASIGGDIRLRHWRPGDRFQPIGMHSPIKLQDFLTNAKVSRAVRVGLVVAEDSSGRIFWVEGCRISEVHKVTPTTKTRFKWRWERSNLRLQRPA